MKLEKVESRLRDECNRERDRQIELAIERLEKETLDMKTCLQQSSENRLRCIIFVKLQIYLHQKLLYAPK